MKYFLLLLLLPIITKAQLFENFDDGDFTHGIVWQGDLNKFKINENNQLQLFSSGEGTAILSTNATRTDFSEWNIWVKAGFSPSDNNQVIIYLTADDQDPAKITNAYYLKLGESGSNDAIELYKKSSNQLKLIARGTEGFISKPFNIRIKIIKKENNWEIWADSTGNSNFQYQASGTDSYWQTYPFIIISCKHTSSNAQKLWFDDIYVGNSVYDTLHPFVNSSSISSQSALNLSFNESMDTESLSVLSNYFIDQGMNSPVEVELLNENNSEICLHFTGSFIKGSTYKLKISNLQDQAGNSIVDTTIIISYDPISQSDIVINEIMFDQSPPNQLPDCEYLELYNRTDNSINLKGWELCIGESKKKFPDITIAPKHFHIITGTGNDSLFATYGNATAIAGFSLSNSGEHVMLKNENGKYIHSIDYSPEWYNDVLKDEGGWSIEQIDANNPCGDIDNWRAAICPEGGTPGMRNSVASINPDLNGPTINYISIASPSSICVHFNEILDSVSLSSPSNYSVEPNNVTAASVTINNLYYNAVDIVFNTTLSAGTTYQLSIKDELTDCAGNKLTKDSKAYFGLADTLEPNDIVINELLFDARKNGEEFIEFYNRSNKILCIHNLYLALRNSTSGEITDYYKIDGDDRLLLPGNFLVVTAQPSLLLSEYFTCNASAFLHCKAFPSLPNEAGTVVLLTGDQVIIDEFSYTSNMHFALLSDTKGISLERVNYNSPTNLEGNWHSASQSVGFASPGYQNSQFLQTNSDEDFVKMEPQVISPDNDGYNDILSICCNLDQPGYELSVRVFDNNGRLIKIITDNYLAGIDNILTWDGITEDGSKAPSGIYVIYTQAFSLKGQFKRSKKVVVVSGF